MTTGTAFGYSGHRPMVTDPILKLELEFEERLSDSAFVDKVWRIDNDRVLPFLSVAKSQLLLLFGRERGKVTVTLRGPETRVTSARTPDDAEFLGIFLKVGTFMPLLPPSELVDGQIDLPQTDARSFWMDGAKWEVPSFENVETFVAALAKEGLLVRDELVEAVSQGDTSRLSSRSLQRRFQRATGLTPVAVRQIQRAQKTVRLLRQGSSILDAVHEAGFVDQAHLTHALGRFVGQTPAQMIASPAPTSIF